MQSDYFNCARAHASQQQTQQQTLSDTGKIEKEHAMYSVP